MNINNNQESFVFINQYAPVIIPTLDRYDHFCLCLESLEKCALSGFTEVYVGLDYPPSEKYVEGWMKIDEYLSEKEKRNSFKKLHVFRRESNCGVGKPTGNNELLMKEVSRTNDRYIFTEDDNVFSFRFLEYMNRGLEMFKEDKSVFSICGYIHPYDYSIPKSDSTCVKLQEMSAWGYGSWFDRRFSREEMNLMVNEYLSDNEIRKHFHEVRPDIFTGLMTMKDRNIIWGDCLYTANLFKTKRHCIFPLLSLVQNHGWDGKGTNGGILKGFSDQAVEGKINTPFSFVMANEKETRIVNESIVRYWKHRTSFIHRVLNEIEIQLYSLTGKVFTFKGGVKLVKKVRSWWYRTIK